MASFNKVILMGNLTRDPQLRYLPSNMAVCEFGLATNRKWKDRDGNQKEDTCFVDVSAFGRQAEVINQYMKKGSAILIEGHLRFESWTGQDGQKRSRHRVGVENFQFVGGRSDQSGGGGSYERSAPPDERGRSAPAAGPPEAEDLPPAGDDIPF